MLNNDRILQYMSNVSKLPAIHCDYGQATIYFLQSCSGWLLKYFLQYSERLVGSYFSNLQYIVTVQLVLNALPAVYIVDTDLMILFFLLPAVYFPTCLLFIYYLQCRDRLVSSLLFTVHDGLVLYLLPEVQSSTEWFCNYYLQYSNGLVEVVMFHSGG